jgi:hypothetical protein
MDQAPRPNDVGVADYLKVTSTHAAALRHSRHPSLRGLHNLIRVTLV